MSRASTLSGFSTAIGQPTDLNVGDSVTNVADITSGATDVFISVCYRV